MLPDDRLAFLLPPAQRRRSPIPPDQAHRQRHRPPGPDYPHPNSHPAVPETTCSDCGHPQRQSASSKPPAESLENARTLLSFSARLASSALTESLSISLTCTS